ncbi:choice-of-anchor O protein [Thiomicrorhabdus aquaedulcis]|uniref:choice-of-anchor O protein n=1 Tax=Thiomicrorhabdus aquaedulcis TaxID=2211106 RepID=UPI000FDB26BD|nr:choice-of-anchor O protein [Thiomicrorhabdus aquaedulcis]
MKLQKKALLLAMTATFAIPMAQAETAPTQLQFSDPIRVNDRAPADFGQGNKVKLDLLGNGMLISTFGEAVDGTKLVYDPKDQVERPASDIFVRTCNTITADCSVESNWSNPVNLSNTATRSSMNADWQGINGEPSAFWGDSDKPNVSTGGTNVMVSWTDKFCPAMDGDTDGTNQRAVTYLTRENREIPFSCTYVSQSSDGGMTWSVAKQLSDGSRDAKQDVNKVALDGKAVVTWQEDPLGLSLGEGDGPGDGASGATASHGTDIWISTKTAATDFSAGVRITDNYGTQSASGQHDPIKDATGNLVDDANIESGQVAATRANTNLVGPNIVVAYEESKGSEGLDDGKYVRYHAIPFANPLNPTTVTGQAAGCIISNPTENARRVRFIPQAIPGTESGVQMGIFWKEGENTNGGPSDIMVRLAKNGVQPANMTPAVDPNCATSDFATAQALTSVRASNLSSNTKAGTNNLTDATDTNPYENALAHRGAIVGDDVYVGYSYTTDWALATYTDQVIYDFWLRHYDGTTDTWSAAKNLSNLPTNEFDVREPRFVKTPAGDGYNPNAFIVAWGLQTNVPTHIESPEDVDIMYTRSFDKGQTFEPVVSITNPEGVGRFESQLRPTPDGLTLYAAWNESTIDGKTKAMIAVAETIDAPVPEPLPAVATSSSSGGCSLNQQAKFDPLLPALLLAALGFLGFRRFSKK